jgi:RNA polymerase sigma-70 factor (ECF subfamily)
MVKRIKDGDTKAFEDLYLTYGRSLYVFAMNQLGEQVEAEEIVQEVFIKIWQKRHELKPQSSIKGYLFTIAYRTILKTYEKRKRSLAVKDLFIQEFMAESNQEDQDIDYVETLKRIDAIVGKLPEKRRQVFILNKKEGLTNSEIADYLQISEKTVKNHLTLALQAIKEQLKNQIPFFLFLLFY